MEIFSAIEDRRSIRKFTGASVSREDILRIIRAGTLAPSAKNRQPWRFVVIDGDRRAEMARRMRAGIEDAKAHTSVPAGFLNGALYSAGIMEQAAATVFILNADRAAYDVPADFTDYLMDMTGVQSIGACIENMSLAAVGMGLGTLWICDVFFAHEELRAFLNTDRQMVAALSIGVPAESPAARPREDLDTLIKWV